MPPPPGHERTVIIEDESLRQFVGGFTSIPNRILRNSVITLGARMCYAMLLSYAWQDDFCFPAQIRLAEDLGIGERTVRQYLNELREAGLITWKQQGLNKPNIYRILKLPALVSAHGTGHPGPADSAAPDRHDASGQDRNPTADYEDSRNKTQVVNDVTANDPTAIRTMSRPKHDRRQIISDRALRAKYQLSDEQIDRVHRLVAMQADILSAGDRNHAAYVQRAAEAVRDGAGNLLDATLGEFKQAATEIGVGSRPAYFHAMWTEAVERHASDQAPVSLPAPKYAHSTELQTVGDAFAHVLDHHQEHHEDPRTRLITDAERRGFRVPDYIRTADIPAVNRWWAALAAEPERRP